MKLKWWLNVYKNPYFSLIKWLDDFSKLFWDGKLHVTKFSPKEHNQPCFCQIVTWELYHALFLPLEIQTMARSYTGNGCVAKPKELGSVPDPVGRALRQTWTPLHHSYLSENSCCVNHWHLVFICYNSLAYFT